MKGVAPFDVKIGQVISAAIPFILIELLVLALLIIFPALATWLPDKIN
jgi:TRAP-type mannitol/chloroaromatic compound transport system permease large subunit